jgi:hypothetical protein
MKNNMNAVAGALEANWWEQHWFFRARNDKGPSKK